MAPDRPPLVFLVGPTASGKSAAAVFLAERFGGEIVGCDSMQVYRGFDIGTDKPSAEDRARVPHHLLDVAVPAAQFSAAEFAARAMEAVAAIRERGRLPLIVGGTGLYFKALEDGLFPGPGRDEALRRTFDDEARAQGSEVLWRRLETVDPAAAARIGRNDRIRIVRALEVQALTGIPLSEHFPRTKSPLVDYRLVKIGLQRPREELVRRIEERVERMFARGLVREVRTLLENHVPETAPPFLALGYFQVLRHLRGEIPLDEAIEKTKIETRQYAKRQTTWFRKMKNVVWFPAADLEAIAAHLEAALAG